MSLIVLCIPSAFGQLPKRVEKCLPYPTLAQEIKAMQPPDAVPQRARVHVIRVEFDSKDGIPADVLEEISTELRSHIFRRDPETAYLDNLANEIAEIPVRGAFRNRGYFKVTAAAKLTPLQSEGEDISIVASISVTPGPQYRTGDIRLESTDISVPLAMSLEVLRGLIPLQRGELFSVERIRSGLENLARAYGREGYIDMTPEPETEVDEARGTIDLVIKIDQQLQYRVGSIEFLGVETAARAKLMGSLPRPGEIFDRARVNEFFKLNRAILPSDASWEDMNITRNHKARTVAILFDFRTCPRHSN